MAVRKTKSPHASSVFEKINRERLAECAQTIKSARKTIETSKKLTEEAQVLLESIHKQRPRTG
jgi:predicted metal-dependent hydrolase